MSSEATFLILATTCVVIYFGPTVARVVLKPEKGSLTDLRIAWWETFLNDFEKRHKITEKTTALAQKNLGLEIKQDESVAREEQSIRESLGKEGTALREPETPATKKESSPP